MTNIGLLGGTFNPIHMGHLTLAQNFLAQLSLDEVVLIPDKSPVHKPELDLAPGEDRLTMCEIAAAGAPGITVDDVELRRKEKSYTVLTLEDYRRCHPQAQLYFLMGTDMFLTLEGWHQYERLFQLAVMCVGARDSGEETLILDALKRYRQYYPIRAEVLRAPPFPVSSTQLRERLRRGETTEGLLPPGVKEYIERRGLYGTK